MKTRLILTALLAGGFALAGCSSTAPQPQVASATEPTASAVATPAASPSRESDYDKALRFTRCMNALGEKIPDPVEGKPLQTWTQDQSGFGVESPNFPKCKQYLPATWPVKVDPKQLAKEAKFTECMRKRGITVPEPDANGMVHYSTDTSYQQSPEYRAAEDSCRYLYDDRANN